MSVCLSSCLLAILLKMLFTDCDECHEMLWNCSGVVTGTHDLILVVITAIYKYILHHVLFKADTGTDLFFFFFLIAVGSYECSIVL